MDQFFSRVRLKKILFFGFLFFILIQLYRPNKNNASYVPINDFLEDLNAPDTINSLIKNSCYDCHSNQTNYKWFDNIAPVSWWIDNNIERGKTSFNFSDWKAFQPWRKLSYLNAIVFDIQTNKMPKNHYVLMHLSAKLSKNEKQLIIDWINSINKTDIYNENEIHY
jgi:hypothetical protein